MVSIIALVGFCLIVISLHRLLQWVLCRRFSLSTTQRLMEL